MLIILDNFEHLLEAAIQVTEILHAAPQVQILVTSRERLHVREEQLFPLLGLTFPDWEAPVEVGDYTAMALFVQSARRVEPDFSLQPQDMVDLTRICRLVGGMPLGLELAASWVEMLSLKDIVAELQRGIDFLETDLVDMPARHRSMRAVFDSSWGQLNGMEQEVFGQLSVFRGGFTWAASQGITGASLRTLARLVSKSLVQFNRTTERYQLHELLRQYGAEKLTEDPEQEKASRDRHSAYYCAELERSMELTRAGQMQTALVVVETDIRNIQAAWDWAVGQLDVALIDQGLEALCWFYEWHWHAEEGWSLCQTVVEKFTSLKAARDTEEDVDGAVQIDRILVRALIWQGLFSFSLKPFAEVTRFLNEGMSRLKDLEVRGVDVHGEKVYIFFFQGVFSVISNDRKAGRQYFLDSLELTREIGDQWWQLLILAELGDLARFSGDHVTAKEWYEKYLALARAQQNLWEEVGALNSLGWMARILVSYEEARRLFESSLALAESRGNVWGVIRATESLGYLSLFLGNLESAKEMLQKSISLNNEIGKPERAIAVLCNLGVAYWLAGEFQQAETNIRRASGMAHDLGRGWAIIWPTICYAELLVLTGRYTEAYYQMQTVDKLSSEMVIGNWEGGRITRTNGWIALAKGEYEKAYTYFKESVAMFQDMGDDEQVAWSQAGLGRAAVGIGDLDGARETLTDALWTAIEIQAFIPLIFTLPMTAFLVAADDPTRGAKIYHQAWQFPLVAKAKMFEDLVGRHLEYTNVDEDVMIGVQGIDPRSALFASAGGVLANWVQAWLED